MKVPSRRQFLRGCGAGVVGLAGCLGRSRNAALGCSDDELVQESEAELSRSASWPTYQHDAANTGYDPDATGPADDVELAWRQPTCTEASSGVVVHAGKVAAGGLVVDGRSGEVVSGEWDAHASTPTFASGRCYVGAHDLRALDATTGDVEWTFETESDKGGLGTTAVVDGTVYTRGQFDDPTVYAVDASDGQEAWRFALDAESGRPLGVVDETVYVVDETSTIYAIDAVDGDERWRRSPAATIERSTPVLADGTVYLGSSEGTLLALGADDGGDVWLRDLGSESLTPLVVAAGTLFLAGPDRTVLALSAADGDEEWSRSLESAPSGPPVVADGVVYVGAGRTLYALDASTGEERWRFETREVTFGDYVRRGINGGLAVADGIVYVATAPGDLYALGES